jgi:hypothetical protein
MSKLIPSSIVMSRTLVFGMCAVALAALNAADPLLASESLPAHAVPSPPTPDPLAGTLAIAPGATSHDVKADLARMLPPRTDSPTDWHAGLECLHDCGEPRLLAPCVPPPPCYPGCPPAPYDLIGVDGVPTRGPRYRGPCCPRTGTHDDGPFPNVHRIHDRSLDLFYRTK